LFEIETGRLVSLTVPGQGIFFGLLGRREDYIIPWESVKRIGDDIILIDVPDDAGFAGRTGNSPRDFGGKKFFR
jgi:sporulation protein YlmC with PRC-barrel domain